MKRDNCFAKKITPETLMILPCCSKKKDGGSGNYEEYLSKYISRDCYKRIIETRKNILSNLKQNEQYITGKYLKNKNIKAGKDFGEANNTGKYTHAIDRYAGFLYSAVPDFPRLVRQSLKKGNGPRIIILSALYGPLHPLDMIQDYNLKMSDKPAYTAWETTFCSFLPEFVVDNEIKHILVYLGKQTAYFKVVQSAIRKLRDVPTINVIHFNVKNGTSYLTPHNHGLCIAKHLGYSGKLSFNSKIEEQPFE